MNTLQTAQSWIAAGYSVIPIGYRSKRPAFDALRLTGDAEQVSWDTYKQRAASECELRLWFSGPRRNLGIVTGWRGLVVLDFDQLDAYDAWLAWARVKGAHAASIAAGTYRVASARGMHVYVMAEEPVESYAAGNVDIKARYGYVLAPPSVHPSGHVYQGRGSQIMRCEQLLDVFPFTAEKPAGRTVAAAQPDTDDPWEAATRAVQCGGVGSIEAAKSRVAIGDLLQLMHEDRCGSWALCPFHADTHPSLRVYPDGHYHCFACGAHGDAVDLYAAQRKLTLREAIAELNVP